MNTVTIGYIKIVNPLVCFFIHLFTDLNHFFTVAMFEIIREVCNFKRSKAFSTREWLSSTETPNHLFILPSLSPDVLYLASFSSKKICHANPVGCLENNRGKLKAMPPTRRKIFKMARWKINLLIFPSLVCSHVSHSPWRRKWLKRSIRNRFMAGKYSTQN